MPAVRNETEAMIASSARLLRFCARNNGAPGKFWHKSAPERLRRAFRMGDEEQAWSAWKRHLAGAREPLPLEKLLPGRHSPLGWALPDAIRADRAAELLAIAGASAEREVAAWLSHAAGASPSAGYALEALACCHALPGLARWVSKDAWWSLLEHLVATAVDAESLPLQSDPLSHQLLAGELPLALAYLLPEITPCRKLAPLARAALSAGLAEVLDGEGMPHASHLDLLRPLMACWTRCRAIGSRLAKGCWNQEAEAQYRWVVRAALRVMRHDGSQAFSRRAGEPWPKSLFGAALQLAGDEDACDIAAWVLPGVKSSRRSRVSPSSLPEPALHSEWSAVAVLRPGWSRKEPRLTVAYPGTTVDLELGCGSDMVWSGRWELDVRRDGQPVQPQSDWEEVCWYSDDDVDYLELEISLTEGFRVQRHMLMAREDRFLLLADAILGREEAKLEYRGALPLTGGIRFQPAEETREALLIGKKPRALVLPLALPEWRCDTRDGSLRANENLLELNQSCQGSALFAPLFLDLDSGRIKRPFTWRSLTVAEDRRPLPHDVAVGYRVKMGNDQWLIYRTLAEPGNRTLLGHNLVSQMLVARFDARGEVDPLIEIE